MVEGKRSKSSRRENSTSGETALPKENDVWQLDLIVNVDDV